MLKVDYTWLGQWRTVVVTTFLAIILYLAIVYLHPENLDWVGSEAFSWSNLLWFVLIDQFLIELVTVTILFQLIKWYAWGLRLTSLKLRVLDIVIYQIRFLPLFLLAFFIFSPVSVTLRFLLHHLPNLSWEVYLAEYFFSTKLYFNYLTPVLIIGYGIINVNLLRNYNKQLGTISEDLAKRERQSETKRLWAADDFGDLFLELRTIVWIERLERKTFAFTEDEKYRLKETLTELAEKLPSEQFLRINRGVFVNISWVLNYSFWEHDKYVLRMKAPVTKEFIMPRDRLRKIKNRLIKTG